MNRIRLFKECILMPVGTTGCVKTVPNRNISSVLRGKSIRSIQRSECMGPLLEKSYSAFSGAAAESRLCASSFILNKRSMSTGDEGGSERKIKPVFVAIPNPFKVIRNNIFYWLIRSYFDPDFSIDEFTQGAKQALVTISQEIAEGTIENLEGLLSPKLLREIKNTCRGFSLKEISSLTITAEEILHTFPHDIAIHYDDKGGKFLFILMKFWCHSSQSGSSDPEVKGFRIGSPPPGVSQEQFDSLGSVYSCTYEFHRNISPGANPQWMITYMQHGQLINTDTRGLPEDE